MANSREKFHLTDEMLNDAAKRICEYGESQRSVAKSMGISESGLRKRLKSVSFTFLISYFEVNSTYIEIV